MSWIDALPYDDAGLLPVVAQDASSGEVLMLAWADREALAHTLRTGEAHYHSRSRGELWRKGATSGNTQQIEEVRVDCDGDALLYRVRPQGPACHTGARSCFHHAADGDGPRPAPDPPVGVLGRIEAVVASRDRERPDGSYTTYLFEEGLDKTLKKLGEEATETVIAAKNADPAGIAAEAADLLYHLLVVLRQSGTELAAVHHELERRFGGGSRLPSERARTPITERR